MCDSSSSDPYHKLVGALGLIQTCSLLLAGLLLSGCGQKAINDKRPTPLPSNAPEGILRIGHQGSAFELDPALLIAPQDRSLILALGEGLVALSDDGLNVVPAAAGAWDLSEDGRVLNFHLREHACWSGGVPVSAADFVESFRRILKPGSSSAAVELLSPVKNAERFHRGELGDFAQVGIEALDTVTLRITLERACPNFISRLCSASLVPVNSRLLAQAGRNWTQPGIHEGNGPYQLTERQPDGTLVLTANPLYRKAGALPAQRLEFVPLENSLAEEAAFMSGALDVTQDIPATKIASHANREPPIHWKQPQAETWTLVCNTRRPPLDDPRVRRALSLAINRQVLCEDVLHANQQPSERVIPSCLLGRGHSEHPSYAPAEAAELLTAAGYPGGSAFPRLVIDSWTQERETQAICAMWRENLGIECSVDIGNPEHHLQRLARGDFEIALLSSATDVPDPSVFLLRLAKDSPRNVGGWVHPRFSVLLEQAAREFNPARHQALLHQAEQIVQAELPVIPLHQECHNRLVHPRLQGWNETPFRVTDFTRVRAAAPLSPHAE